MKKLLQNKKRFVRNIWLAFLLTSSVMLFIGPSITIGTNITIGPTIVSANVVGWASDAAREVTEQAIVSGLLKVLNPLFTIWLGLSNFFLWLSGLLLNTSVYLCIVKMGSIITANNGDNAIQNMWVTVRDLINISFIFGLLYISITTIIKGWEGNDSKALLKNIIIAALFINFSFFFTTTLIDLSNILTISIHKKMSECSIPEGLNPQEMEQKGISFCFMNALKLQTGFKETNHEGGVSPIAELGSRVTAILMIGLFSVVASVVFMAIAFQIIARFILLIFLIISSPIMFLGFIFPKLDKASKKWFSEFGGALLSIPILFMGLYITYTILISNNLVDNLYQTSGMSTTNSSFAQLAETGYGSFSVLLNFVILISFLIGSLVLAKSASSAISKGGISISKLAMGGVARTGRTVVGRFGYTLANEEGRLGKSLKSGANSEKPIVRVLSKGLLRAANKAKNSSFDVRNIKGAAAALKAVNNITSSLGGKEKKEKKEKKGKPNLGEVSTASAAKAISGKRRKREKFMETDKKLGIKPTEGERKSIEKNILSGKNKKIPKDTTDDLKNMYKSIQQEIGLLRSSKKDVIKEAREEIKEAQMDVETAPPKQKQAAKLRLANAQSRLIKAKGIKIESPKLSELLKNKRDFLDAEVKIRNEYRWTLPGSLRRDAVREIAKVFREKRVKPPMDKIKKSFEESKKAETLKNNP